MGSTSVRGALLFLASGCALGSAGEDPERSALENDVLVIEYLCDDREPVDGTAWDGVCIPNRPIECGPDLHLQLYDATAARWGEACMLDACCYPIDPPPAPSETPTPGSMSPMMMQRSSETTQMMQSRQSSPRDTLRLPSKEER